MNDFNIPPRIASGVNRLLPHYIITPDPADETPYRSYLGTPVWSPLEFIGTSGTSKDNSTGVGGAIGKREGQVWLRIDNCLMTVTQDKIITRTQVPGRRGTVKEYIGEDDFNINIRGSIVSEYPLIYPREEVSLLIEFLRLPKQLPIASEFLQLFDIHSFVVDSYTVAEKLGSRNEVPFEIHALSDWAEEIILNPNSEL
jgi:hypothetical protein